MGRERYAFLFQPGTYGSAEDPLQLRVGYYTEVAGLGESPSDVTVHGKVEVFDRCFGSGAQTSCNALTNFWRTVSNLRIEVDSAGQEGCRAGTNFWAVSQAVSMRRVEVTGGQLSLMDYCSAGPSLASGGFIADSKLPNVVSGSQQQWLTRDSEVAGWSNGVWNQAFSGVEGAPATEAGDAPPYTVQDRTPLSREKPYLFVDSAGDHQVRVPAAQRGSRGVTWDGGQAPGRTVPLSDFYVARPTDSVARINSQLARGKHLLLTPGVYDVERSIAVERARTVVLGVGHATLSSRRGAVPRTVGDVPGAVVAGLTVDAGAQESSVLLRVGTKNARKSDPADPVTLSDVYFRVGGPQTGRAEVSLEVNSDHVLLDHIWAWRADHGLPGTYGWDVSTGRNGVVVDGDDVSATGLFVEHYQQYNVVWNGERGRTFLFQNELPYDPPNQAAWQHDGTLGWAAYKVADHVRRHELAGAGSYVFTNVDPSLHASHGFEVPRTEGVRLRHLYTVNLTAGTLDSVVNGVGAPVTAKEAGQPSYVLDYP
ncbi:transglutaminase domain-containing protein [Paenibacillus sp. TRM 82003]|uniref:adenylyl cyclase n=1 Tax=Kineococcus sp. TRM81007 TaxID=2925831 RepID=UPI001F5927AF|nr:adenylyl cyclase [Kineococcus sp. TRM81007]MCI2238697.1 adenylyl cyclase [Kineococcus sp. TRM81007]MCI3927359.1 transglutaminase domain-containing protein [Paenibacillus sp. TRM 82003]